ncbi:hypothetical protein [Holdemanella porci]|uniref:hypothetical protein n=1 Tax=Holdemanella porci TaxID=2652276 RepID=UPI0022E5124E|nr:hypothetical protein [Holdemanella porci]
MKILRLIDRYVDSFEKRIFIFVIFITMYWLWQNIWQLLLFYKVYFIADYEACSICRRIYPIMNRVF